MFIDPLIAYEIELRRELGVMLTTAELSEFIVCGYGEKKRYLNVCIFIKFIKTASFW